MSNEMQTNDRAPTRGWAVGMAIIAGLVRLIPHPLNFTPVAGLGLFGGARLRSWWAYVLPLAVMAVSDVLLWLIAGHHNFTLLAYAFNPWVYASFLLAVVWGRWLLRDGSSSRIVLASLLVSAQFFLVTNFGIWLSDVMHNPSPASNSAIEWQQHPNFPAPIPLHYGHNLSGLLACYVAALPFVGSNAPPLGFLGNQLLGDLFYTGLIFGLYACLRSGVFLPRRAAEPVAARTP